MEAGGMTRRQRIARLELARTRVHAGITNAYWTFTRTARGKPPAMTVPHLYAERRRLDAEIRELRARSAR
jgi:hypothetical protein